MVRAIYPGSFDPVTNGHLDVLTRAAKLFDEVLICVAHNDSKTALFTMPQRVELLKQACAHLSNVRVTSFQGLLVDFARSQNVHAIIRGLRAISDFELEFQMALMNRKLEPKIETLFLTPSEEYTYLSSRMVKEICRLGGNIEPFVPQCVTNALNTALK